MVPHAPKSQLSLISCHGPSTAWPTFARRERRKRSAIPVGMTDMANSPRFTRPQAAPTFRNPACPERSRRERSSPIFSFAPQLGASGCVVEGPGQRLRLNLDFNGRNKLAEHQCGKSSLRSRNFGFMERIRASFFSRRQLLICFCRLMADLIWPCGSR